jgi:hypothetical protein
MPGTLNIGALFVQFITYPGYLIYDIERIHLKLELKMQQNPTIY